MASLTFLMAGGIFLQAQTPQIVELGPHHRVIETVTWELDATGETVVITNRYTDLASGMHFLADPRIDRWEESREEFEITRQGYAIAVHGNHKVILAPNINQGGSVDLELPDGQRLISNPMGLAFFDRASGRSVLLAEAKDCVGTLVADNVVLYEDCFDDLTASLRYTYSRAGFEQFVLLHEHPGFPEDYGMDPATTTLEMFTELFHPPQPEITAGLDGGDLVDNELDFGSMRMGPGLAYTDRADPMDAAKIWNSWENLDGRQFLIGFIPYPEAERFLDGLEFASSALPAGRTRAEEGRASVVRQLVQRENQPVDEWFIAGSSRWVARPTGPWRSADAPSPTARIQSDGRVASEGLPHVLNRVVSLANVHEQPVVTGGNTFIDLPGSLYPIMEFRFTDLSLRQGGLGTILANQTCFT